MQKIDGWHLMVRKIIRTNLNNSILSSTRTIRLKLVKKIRANQEHIS